MPIYTPSTTPRYSAVDPPTVTIPRSLEYLQLNGVSVSASGVLDWPGVAIDSEPRSGELRLLPHAAGWKPTANGGGARLRCGAALRHLGVQGGRYAAEIGEGGVVLVKIGAPGKFRRVSVAWSEEDVDRLWRLWIGGKSMAKIAAEMRRSRAAIGARISAARSTEPERWPARTTAGEWVDPAAVEKLKRSA